MPRPQKPIDSEKVVKLAERFWTLEEIASFFGVSHDTIHRRFATIIEKSRHSGTAKLIDLMWQRAEEGSDKILIHMAKQYLGHADKLQILLSDVTDEELATECDRRLKLKP